MIELASIIILGILAQWISWKIKVPAILPLIIIGLFFGPISTLFSVEGEKWINPIYNTINETGLFPENTFFFFVSLSIGLILFEGGLTLEIKDFGAVSSTILKLISIGSLITLLGGGSLAHYILDLDWQISFLFSGLIVVTGPTVIAPILRSLPIKRNVATVLKWEGILIDPIGALIAVLVFEFILSGESGSHFTLHALSSFGQIVLIGTSFGFTAAHFLNILVKRNLVPHYLLNVFTLALALSVFVFSDIIAGESGLLAVVVMGVVLGNLNVPYIKGILDFKESLSVLLISILFIVLSASIEIEQIKLLLDYKVLILFFSILLILRPISVFISSRKSALSTNEKIFISLMGPRGIVAAGIASLFGMKLTGIIEGAEYITPLVFMVVLGTVLINSLTARITAKGLNVLEKGFKGYLIVGANSSARLIGKYLLSKNKHVVLVDNSQAHVDKAHKDNIEAFKTDIYSDTFGDDFALIDIGYLIAITPSADLNKYVIDRYKKQFGKNGAYRLVNDSEFGIGDEKLDDECAFTCQDDYNRFSETVRDYPFVYECKLKSLEDFKMKIEKMLKARNTIPVFINRANENIEIIPSHKENVKIEEGDILVYIGKELEGC